MSESSWKSYIGTWKDKRENIADYELHEEMAYRVDIPGWGKDYSNVASFSLSIQCIGGWHHVVLPFVVSSCDISIEKDSTAFYWQKSGPDLPVVSVGQLFHDNPLYGDSVAESTLNFLRNLAESRREGKYGGENWEIDQAIQLVMKRIESGSYLSHLINPVGTETGKGNGILRSVLHCEQVILNKLLQDDRFLHTFICGLKKYFDKEILAMDLGIVTYNDMCPKCFSTCKHRKLDLLKRFNDGFSKLGYKEEAIAPNKFRILISSHEAYKISETGYVTGNTVDSHLCADENIFQFKNVGIPSSVEKINSIEDSRSKKCKEIDDLFKQIEIASGIKAQPKSKIIDLSYWERINAISKSLASSKGDRPLPACNPSEQLYKIIQSENGHLEMIRGFVNTTLEQIRQKLKELNQIGFF